MHKGELLNAIGTVVAIEDDHVKFTFQNEEFNEIIQMPLDFVAKYFIAGDHCIVIDGRFTGEIGLLTKIDGNKAYLYSDYSKREIEVPTNLLKLTSDTSIASSTKCVTSYQVFDLVQYNNSKNVGVILQIERDMVKLLDELGDVQNIKINDINKKRN